MFLCFFALRWWRYQEDAHQITQAAIHAQQNVLQGRGKGVLQDPGPGPPLSFTFIYACIKQKISSLGSLYRHWGLGWGNSHNLAPAELPGLPIFSMVYLAIQQQQDIHCCYFETVISAKHFYRHKCIFYYCLGWRRVIFTHVYFSTNVTASSKWMFFNCTVQLRLCLNTYIV